MRDEKDVPTYQCPMTPYPFDAPDVAVTSNYLCQTICVMMPVLCFFNFSWPYTRERKTQVGWGHKHSTCIKQGWYSNIEVKSLK